MSLVSMFTEFLMGTKSEEQLWITTGEKGTLNSNEPALIQGSLTYIKNSSLKVKIFKLIHNGLLRQSSQGDFTKFTELSWRIVEFFSESNEGRDKFGFSVFYSSFKTDFYVKNETELLLWKEKLEGICICTDFPDNFVVIKKLGAGKSGEVFLVEDLHTRKEYAMKCIKKNTILSERKLESLYNEIKIMRSLNHPNIVKLHKVYENEKCIKMILDYCPFGTLYSRLLSRKKIDESVAKKFSRRLLETVDFLHGNRIMHRDIKLENILMTSDSDDTSFKIGDFGLSCEVHNTHYLRCGSPGYVAPEILRDKKYNHKADIFSCGIVIFALIGGYLPFTGENPNEILLNNCKCKINFEDKIWKKVSYLVVDLLSELLEPNPELRPDAAEALLKQWIIRKKKIKEKSPATGIFISESPAFGNVNILTY
ncbi:hypothetical protein SteCoe_4024 [Stentor coeruleus]|uniref:Protein kinase domain-containing protein n=1 Tax=Stentor coeruleus TaxID=5963 RepID=A0A1R2CVR5_9CILI|nr:hypothetical protein SteCoe_4024 [Stentor coeruleus]